MALELTFEGSSEIFFHSFFNLTLGPLPSNEKLISRSQYYPEVWIEQHRRLGEFAIVREEEEGNERLMAKRSRRGTWAPNRPLGWIHLNMLNLSDQIRDVLMTKTGLAFAWSRAYRDIDTELNLLQPFHSLDSIAAIFGLMLEGGAEIGDSKRFVAARECLKLQLGYLHDIPELKRVSPALIELPERHITEAHAVSYEPVASKLAKYPLTWGSRAYKYWIAELSEKKLNR